MYNIVRFCPGWKSAGAITCIPSFPARRRRMSFPQARGEVMTGVEKMRFAIVESGGKQYRAVEGGTIDVDRLPVEAGAQIDLDRILLVADEEDVVVGTPTVSGFQVKATVVDHVKGPKVVAFKYSPKKRIRVKTGHRQQYTRLLVNFIGKPGEERKMTQAEAPVSGSEPQAEETPKASKPAKGPKKEAAKDAAKQPAAAKSSAKKSTTSKK